MTIKAGKKRPLKISMSPRKKWVPAFVQELANDDPLRAIHRYSAGEIADCLMRCSMARDKRNVKHAG